MLNGFIKVAAVSTSVQVADCDLIARHIVTALSELTKKGVSIAVFPELCITGATCGDLFWQTTLIDGAQAALSGILADSAE